MVKNDLVFNILFASRPRNTQKKQFWFQATPFQLRQICAGVKHKRKNKRKNCNPNTKNIALRPPLWLHPSVPQPAINRSRRRLTVHYSGRVQGVGFRYTARTVAAGFDITGTIRNLPDGRVELVAEGESAELDAFRAAILDAGLAGFIRDEQISWMEATNEFRGFEIVR
jgi:acylphosphatase